MKIISGELRAGRVLRIGLLLAAVLALLSFETSLSAEEARPMLLGAATNYADLCFQRDGIISLMRNVNEWTQRNPIRGREKEGSNWNRATWYDGVVAAYKATGEPHYWRQAMEWGQLHQWQIGRDGASAYAANDLFATKVYANLFLLRHGDPGMSKAVNTWVLTPGEHSPAGEKPPGKVWYTPNVRYVDSLYGIAALAAWASVNGDNAKLREAYLDALHDAFWTTTEELYDKEDHLYYRHKAYDAKRTAAGKKIFWSRGQGWAIAAVAQILEHLPMDHADRPGYVRVLREMSEALAKRQCEDGLWRPNVDDPSEYSMPETSGSSFICYGMAWGVNNGVLDAAIFLPVVKKAWAALAACVTPEGRLLWCQPAGHEPVAVLRDEPVWEYGAGAFLLGASEMLRRCDRLDAAGTRLRQSESSLIPVQQVASHPFGRQIASVLARQGDAKDFKPTGFDRREYLRIIASQVGAFRKHQNAEGRIIDPVRKVEVQYATPMYAHAAAVLVKCGYDKSPEMLASAMLAMDVAVADLAGRQTASGPLPVVPAGNEVNTSDFYIWPIMKAFYAFSEIAPTDRLAKWLARLSTLDPTKAYCATAVRGSNWAVCHVGGEFLRSRQGWTSLAYAEQVLDLQRGRFAPHGLYHDHSAAFAYDAFARYFVTGMLQAGYRGRFFDFFREMCWRGAWASLLTQSPSGEMPVGERSAQHIWNEAEMAAIFEMYASAYAAAGKPTEAGMFKRGAHLAARSMGQWLRPDSSGYIVKNRYPAEAAHGYESYSRHSCYNLQSCSMLALACETADDSIVERPAPSDIGGFIVQIDKAGLTPRYNNASSLEA